MPSMMLGIAQKDGILGTTHFTTNSGLRLKNIPFCPRVHDADHVRDVKRARGSCASAGRLCSCGQGLVPPVFVWKVPLMSVRCHDKVVATLFLDLVAIQRERLGKHKFSPSRCYNHGRAGRKSTSAAGVYAGDCDIPVQQAARAEQGTLFRCGKRGPLPEGDLQGKAPLRCRRRWRR